MGISVAERVQKYRSNLRESGLRPIQIWVPDTRNPHFLEECIHQSRLIKKEDNQDEELTCLMEDLLADMIGIKE